MVREHIRDAILGPGLTSNELASKCKGRCRSPGSEVVYCLIEGCCPGMERFFPKESWPAELAKRRAEHENRSWFKKLVTSQPEQPVSYSESPYLKELRRRAEQQEREKGEPLSDADFQARIDSIMQGGVDAYRPCEYSYERIYPALQWLIKRGKRAVHGLTFSDEGVYIRLTDKQKETLWQLHRRYSAEQQQQADAVQEGSEIEVAYTINSDLSLEEAIKADYQQNYKAVAKKYAIPWQELYSLDYYIRRVLAGEVPLPGVAEIGVLSKLSRFTHRNTELNSERHKYIENEEPKRENLITQAYVRELFETYPKTGLERLPNGLYSTYNMLSEEKKEDLEQRRKIFLDTDPAEQQRRLRELACQVRRGKLSPDEARKKGLGVAPMDAAIGGWSKAPLPPGLENIPSRFRHAANLALKVKHNVHYPPQLPITRVTVPYTGEEEFLDPSARSGGLFIIGPSGSGKSRLLGRGLCHQDMKQGVGVVVLDMMGATIDNCLSKYQSMGEDDRKRYFAKLRYLDMSGRHGFVSGWPMLHKQYEWESAYETSQRPVDLIAKTDPQLSTASIQGMARLSPLLTSIGMVLFALGEPIIRTFEVIENPDANIQRNGKLTTWRKLIAAAASRDEETYQAAQWVLNFLSLDPRVREERSEPLRNRLSILQLDKASRKMFTAKEPSINWDEVAQQGLQVFIDFRHPMPEKAKELKLFWIWNSLIEYIRSRGADRRHPPLAIVIDELLFFVQGNRLNEDVLARDLREIIFGRKRNSNIWLTVATQTQEDLPQDVRNACLSMHSTLYGRTTRLQTAIENGRRHFPPTPYMLKRWSNVEVIDNVLELNPHYVRQYYRPPYSFVEPLLKDRDFGEFLDAKGEPVYTTIEEQEIEHARVFMELSKGEWLFAKSLEEGEPANFLQRITTIDFDTGQYPEEVALAPLRQQLLERDGISLAGSIKPESTQQPIPAVDRYTPDQAKRRLAESYPQETEQPTVDEPENAPEEELPLNTPVKRVGRREE